MFKSIALFATLISTNAFAAYNGPLLVKSTHSGYVGPGYHTYTKCEIYKNQVVLTIGAENVQSSQTKNISINGDLAKAIEDASKGPYVDQIAPVDGPGVIYTATKISQNGNIENVTLLKDTGGDGRKSENRSPAAIGLRNFLDLNCK